MRTSNKDFINFYFFRHGQTDWNKLRRLQGHSDTNLNELGVTQAYSLKQKLSEFPIDYLISSDLSRALETARIVNENWSHSIKVDLRLREASFGEAEGMTVDELVSRYGEEPWLALKGQGGQRQDICLPGGETRAQANKRVDQVIEEIIRDTNFSHIGVSTHGGVVANYLKFKAKHLDVLEVPNCCCYILRFEKKNGALKAPFEIRIYR